MIFVLAIGGPGKVVTPTAPEYAQRIFHSGVTLEHRADDTETYRKALQRDGIEIDAERASIDQRGAVGYLGGVPGICRGRK